MYFPWIPLSVSCLWSIKEKFTASLTATCCHGYFSIAQFLSLLRWGWAFTLGHWSSCPVVFSLFFFAFSKRLKVLLHILMKLFLLSSFPPAPLGSSVLVQRDLVSADFFTPGATQGQFTLRERMGSSYILIITNGFLRWKIAQGF